MDRKQKDIVYKEIQTMWILVIPSVLILGLLAVFFIASTGHDSSVSSILFFNIILFSFIIVLFYRLKIQVTKSSLLVSFGVGLIKKQIDLKKIEMTSFEIVDLPWYVGVGLRSDFSGNTIYSAKFGSALSFKLKDSLKKIMIVTDNKKELQNVLESQLKL